MSVRTIRNISAAAAVLVVLTVYAFFASYGRFSFHSRAWDLPGGRPADGYYSSLAEGFRRGHVSMAHKADPLLMAMANPYDFEARQQQKVPYLWDASYLNGRYYLYFTPLPALLVYLPHRLLYGAYPSDQLAAALFASWALIMATLLLRRACGEREMHVPLAVWVLVAGIGNVVAFVMVYSRTYEVAAFCGMALSATWAWCLLRFLDSPTNSRLIWTSIWLALAIASRPNLGVLLAVLFVAIVLERRADLLRALVLALVPLAVVGSALAAYNYARFRDPFEFGHRYQLTYMSMADRHVCSCRTPREAMRLVHTGWLYTATPLAIKGEFPFFRATRQGLDPKVSFADVSDLLAGVGATTPIAILGTLLAAILAMRRNANDRASRGGLLLLAAGWLVLLGLSACWYASARYELDFALLITVGAIVCIERSLSLLSELGVSLRLLRMALIALACYSIVVGLFLGFSGPEDAFPWEAKEAYGRAAAFFR